MRLRALVAAEALEWIGTPWLHQASVKGVGCDCVGLVRGVGVACDVMFDPVTDSSRPFRNYSRYPKPVVMKAGLDTYMVRLSSIEEARKADVLWFRIARDPQHLGILVDDEGYMVHAQEGQGVLHHLVDEQKWRRLIVAAWRFPGVEAEEE